MHSKNKNILMKSNTKDNLSRSGHIAVIAPYGYLILFGGFNDNKCLNDIYFVDLELLVEENVTNEIYFEELKIDNLPTVASSAVCCHPTKPILYGFGGSGKDWGLTNYSDLYIIDILTKKVTIENPLNSKPEARYGATLSYYNKKNVLYLFGGTNGTIFFNDLYEFNLQNNIWTKLSTKGDIPKERYKATATLIGTSLYIIGGGTINLKDIPLEIYKLCLRTFHWKKIKYISDQRVKNLVAHAADSHERLIYINGGKKYDDTKNDTIYVFDTVTLKFNKLTNCLAREFHSSVYYKNHLLMVAGSTGIKRLNSIEIIKVN